MSSFLPNTLLLTVHIVINSIFTTKHCPYFPSLIKIGAFCLTESNCDGFVICGSHCFFLNSLGNNLSNGIISTTHNCDANLVYLLV